MIKELINMEADFIGVKDVYGNTPIEKAQQYGFLDIVKRVNTLHDISGSDFESFTDEGEQT